MKKNILIIEDDSFFVELISKKLFSKEFSILSAKDGEEGIKKAKEEKPDLILLDLLLPVMDGYEVLSTLKNDSETSAIPIIILSNLSSKEDIDKGLKLGASDFLIKSQIDLEEIVGKINAFI
ncbi:MAG: response regulator [Candidatus Staskawiczbacteria bacterium]|nr:response regulator [Candidatus Staskawiczbacteria bacterium]